MVDEVVCLIYTCTDFRSELRFGLRFAAVYRSYMGLEGADGAVSACVDVVFKHPSLLIIYRKRYIKNIPLMPRQEFLAPYMFYKVFQNTVKVFV